MQDPAAMAFQGIKGGGSFPEQEQLKCPRCESSNTKFCYYNNYNLSQPRHFCKNCRRYWTKGGALRNIPVGGGTCKNNNAAAKRSSAAKRPFSSSSSAPAAASPDAPQPDPPRLFAAPGSFGSLLASNGHFGGVFDVMGAGQPGSSGQETGPVGGGAGSSEGYLGLQSGDWGGGGGGGGNGWPDLAIYTPGSSFQ